MEDKLNPCPFCGKEAKVNLDEDKNAYFVECTGCFSSSPIMFNAGEDARPHVIEAWNQRLKK